MLELSVPVYAPPWVSSGIDPVRRRLNRGIEFGSKIRVKYSKTERDVELIEGQALFHVAHDVTRPFIVAVGATRVAAPSARSSMCTRNPTAPSSRFARGRVAVYSAPRKTSIQKPRTGRQRCPSQLKRRPLRRVLRPRANSPSHVCHASAFLAFLRASVAKDRLPSQIS